MSQLHQATESFYNCFLLVFTGYRPKTHDLESLNSLCASQSNEFLSIFPKINQQQKDSFELLQKAYIDARYNKDYQISKDQLLYLQSKVKKLRDLVFALCSEAIEWWW